MEKEIKKGDVVFVKETVRYSWNERKSFFVPKKVERLTKTLFILDDGRKFRKKGWQEHSGPYSSRAYFEGQKYGHGEFQRTIIDQTTEMQDFKTAIALEQTIKKVLEPLLDVNKSYIELPADTLKQALEKANELSELLTQK